MPGGGLDQDETSEQAAKRELWEETGIDAEPGPCVWQRRHIFEFRNVLLDEHERFFVMRFAAPATINNANSLAHEHTFLAGIAGGVRTR